MLKGVTMLTEIENQLEHEIKPRIKAMKIVISLYMVMEFICCFWVFSFTSILFHPEKFNTTGFRWYLLVAGIVINALGILFYMVQIKDAREALQRLKNLLAMGLKLLERGNMT